MIRRSTLLAVEIVLGLAAALIIGLGVAWWRLSQGPVELSFLREHVQAELSAARAGRPVSIEQVELAWSRDANALELRAVGVNVEDGRGEVLSRADAARIELGVLPLLIGRISVREAEFRGGELSITRKLDGDTHLAFGPPGSPADIILPASVTDETLEQRVTRILDSLEEGFRPVGPGGRLSTLRITGAKLSIIDEAGGGEWTADAANFELARNGGALAFVADARLEGAEGLAPARLRITTDTEFRSAIVEFGAENVRPRALFSPAALGPFAGLDTPLSANISLGLDRDHGVTRLEGEATLGQGDAEMAGGRLTLSGGSIRGRYEIDSDELVIDRLQLAGDRTRIRGEVRVRDASRIMRAAPEEPAAFNISLPSMALDVPGTFAEPVNFADVQIVGAIVAAERAIQITSISARTEEAQIEGAGRLYWAAAGQDQRVRAGVELNATLSGSIRAQSILHAWPIGLGEGARSYLTRTLQGGRVSDATVRLDIRPSDIAAEAWRDEAVDVRFNVTDGQMQFIETMSPVTHARGVGVLRGNRFDMTIPEARINGMAITQARVEIPRLKPKGALATISARVEGQARNMLEVLQQEPLALGDRLPVRAASAQGQGVVTLRIQRPMLTEVPFEDWRFSIDGEISDFAGVMSTRNVTLSQGRFSVRGDQRMISVTGPVRAGGSAVNVSWNEHLNRRGAASSEYRITGDFDADDLVGLGYTVAEYAEGRIGVTVSGQGRGFDVDNANVQVDLRNAAATSPFAFWTKQPGQAAQARFDVARQSDGSLELANLDARGVGGLVAQGRIRVSADNRLEDVELTRLVLEGRSDANVRMRRAGDGGLDIQVRGLLFDGAPFMDGDDPPGEGRASAQMIAARAAEPPVRADVRVTQLRLRGGALLQNARAVARVERGALAMLAAEGQSPGGGAFSLGLGPRPADPRGRIRLRSEDGGFAMRALTGSENIVGGTASADGEWRAGPPTTARFDVALRDFQVVQMPAMARLLSSAGSLTGLVEMLNGDGIGFAALDAPVVYANDRLTIREARLTGPSLGLTASGSYDIARDDLDIDGVVAPSPILNLSMLSEVPLIGDLLTSRRGEGVVGMTYSINGAVAEPRVGVNPLSALTPGILRRIFEPIQPREAPRPVAQAGDASAP